MNLGGAGARPIASEQTWRLPRGYIDGLILANDVTDGVNDISISAGTCRDSTNSYDLIIDAALIKQLDVVWAPASASTRTGLKSATALANATWHVFAIGGEGRTTDIFADTAVALTPTLLPAGYTYFRRIGSLVRSGGTILAFTQVGDDVQLTTAVTDVNNVADHTTAATGTLTVPTGIKVKAKIMIKVTGNSGNGVLVTSFDVTDVAPSTTVAPGVNVLSIPTDGAGWVGPGLVMTNTSAQVRYRSTNANIDTVIVTQGWIDIRGRDA